MGFLAKNTLCTSKYFSAASANVKGLSTVAVFAVTKFSDYVALGLQKFNFAEGKLVNLFCILVFFQKIKGLHSRMK